MERKLYILAIVLLGVTGIALALHVLRMEDSIPAMVRLHSRYSGYLMSRDSYVHSILLDALLLPAMCCLFAFVAHAGREIDIVSWFFVAGFYLALWWLGWEVNHAYQISDPHPRGIVVGSVSNPLGLLVFAVGVGLGFWKWKQDWDPSSS